MKRLVFLSLSVVLADQAIKAFIRTQPMGASLVRVEGIAEITHSFNTGAAFSVLSGHPVLLALLSFALLAGLLGYVCSQMRLTRPAQLAFAALIGGGAGNLIDRIFFSGVTDYVRLLFVTFPIFNLADMAITSSVGALIVLLFMGKLEITGDQDGSDHHASC